MRKLGAASCISLLLAACAGDEPRGTTPRTVYQCGDLEVTATFDEPDKVALVFGGTTLALPRVPAASGARYADGMGNEFWSKGGAMFTLAGQPPRSCTVL